MCERRELRKKRALRRELASWQCAAIGLLLLAVVGNMVLYGRLLHQRQETATMEAKYRAAQAIGRDAVEAYGRLLAEVEAEREDRAAQMAAYEALAGCQYIGECTLTAYCCEAYPHICGTGDGLTAAGLPVAPGMVAVDPDVIPLGSTVIINGTSTPYGGTSTPHGGTSYLAADTGVEGLHIDIAMQTHAEAEEFGVRSADVWIVKGE